MQIKKSLLNLLPKQPPVENFPYPDPFTPAQRRVIEVAIDVALRTLLQQKPLHPQTKKPFDPTKDDEVDVTLFLVELLNRMLEDGTQVQGFSKAEFQTVVRGGELVNYSGTKPEKKPDMVFRSALPFQSLAQPEHCALFVECKLADKTHPMSLYGGKGITRFVNGDYAWALSSAMMLGYARDGYQLPGELETHLNAYNRYELIEKKWRDRRQKPPLYLTKHKRNLPPYQAPNGATVTHSPGDITLHHMWITIA